MTPIKRVRLNAKFRLTQYHLPNGYIHREDGPAHIEDYYNGDRHESWWYNDTLHRYGGPAIKSKKGGLVYTIHNIDVSDKVEEWLTERGYVWEKMSDVEKWELEMFMRSL